MSTDRRQRRRLPRARRLAKQALVRCDLFRHRDDATLRRWMPALVGARVGPVAIPSRAVASSRAEAADFAGHKLVKAGDRVLDVGAGNGRQAIGLLEMGVAEYVGLEVIERSVEYGNAAFKGLGNVRFDWLDVANDMYNPNGSARPEQVTFPYPDRRFDFVVAGSLYTHLQRIEVAGRYVEETARVLRSGGCALMTWFRSPPNDVSENALRTVFRMEEIERVVQCRFVIEASGGGETNAWHDQWRLYLRKR